MHIFSRSCTEYVYKSGTTIIVRVIHNYSSRFHNFTRNAVMPLLLRTSLWDAVMFCTHWLGILRCSAHIVKRRCDVLHTPLRDTATFRTHCSGTPLLRHILRRDAVMFCKHAKGCCDVLHTLLRDVTASTHTLRDAVMFCEHAKGCCDVLHTLLREATASTHTAQGCCDVQHIQTDLRTNNS